MPAPERTDVEHDGPMRIKLKSPPHIGSTLALTAVDGLASKRFLIFDATTSAGDVRVIVDAVAAAELAAWFNRVLGGRA